MRVQNPPLAAPVTGPSGSRRLGARSIQTLLLALCASCAALLLASSSVPSARAATCPNEAIRTEQGPPALGLPDCRAYELVSPGSIPSLTTASTLESGGGKASPDGDALSFFSRYPAEGSQTSSETWLSRRTGSGWTLRSLDPQMTPNPTKRAECLPGVAISEGLDAFLVSAGGDLDSAKTPASGECALPEEELVPGEPRGYSNLYLQREGDPYALVNPIPAGETPANATFQAASADLSRIVFSENANLLTPAPPTGTDLYMWADGIVRPIGVLPNGEQVPAELGGATREWGAVELSDGWTRGMAPVSHAVSADGERVFFEANEKLYLRENAAQPPAATADCRTTSEPDLACTLRIDVSFGKSVEGGGGVFQFASRDGGRVFFTSDEELRSPSSAEPGKPALYEYRVGTTRPVDLTVNPADVTANVRGFSGGSDDGSHVYFVARGALTGTEQNSRGEEAQPNEPNLYLVSEGALTYIATLAPWSSGVFGGRDRGNWWETEVLSALVAALKTAWSPSGEYFSFSSFKSLTGSDNTPVEPGLCNGEPTCEQIFLYDAAENELSCVSCDPQGDKPVANTRMPERAEFLRFLAGPRYLPRAVLDSGQVFFESTNSLSPGDINGFQDVYEYRDGNLQLISGGTGKGGSAFVDATPDGSDVFFATPEALVRSDRDGGLPSIYDARINGGFVGPPLPPAPCAGEACRPPGPQPPAGSPPATPSFFGPGNVRPRECKRGSVRRGKRCVRKKAHRRHQRGRKACGKRATAKKGKGKCGDRHKAGARPLQPRQIGRKN